MDPSRRRSRLDYPRRPGCQDRRMSGTADFVRPIEPKAFRVLLILLRNPQKLLPKDELLTAVWGDTAVSENSLARSIALLRRLLGDEARTPRFIETVATVGYRFVCPVVSEEDSVAAPTAVSPLAVSEAPAIGNGERAAATETTPESQRKKRFWKWALAVG